MSYYIYFFLSIPISILSVLKIKNINRLTFPIVLLIYIALLSLAYKLGVDWYLYYQKYEDLNSTKLIIDPAFTALFTLFNYLNLDFWFVYILIKISIIIVFAKFIYKHSPYPTFTFVCVVSLSSIFLNDNIRQQAALAVVLFFLSHYNNRLIVFYSGILLASIFHISALSLLPVLMISRSKIIQLTIIFASLIFFVLTLNYQLIAGIVSLLNNHFSDFRVISKLFFYTNNNEITITIGHCLRAILLIPISYIFFKKTDNNKELWNDLSLFYSCFILMIFYEMAFYEIETLWSRLRDYFTIPSMIFLTKLSTKIKYRKSFLSIIFFYCAYSFYSLWTTPFFQESYIPYKNYIIYSLHQNLGFDYERNGQVDLFWREWKPRGQKAN